MLRTFTYTLTLVGVTVGLGMLTAQSTSAQDPDPTTGPQIRIDVGGGNDAANETSIAAAHPRPNEVVGTWNDWRRSTSQEIINMGVGVTNDGGQTWTDFLVRPPAQFQTGVEGDPMTAYDNRTGILWVGAIAFGGNGGMYVARKVPGANAFESSVMTRVGSTLDKGWMAAGPALNDPNSTRVYVAYNLGIQSSSDLGDTWSNVLSLGSGVGFLPRVGPNGEIYVAYWDIGSGVRLKRSLNGGVSYTTHSIATRMDVWSTQDGSRFPGTFRVPSFNYIAVDSLTGTLYCVYADTTNIVNGQRNVDLYFCKSTNQGTSWTTPAVINQDNNPPGDQLFPWMEVDRRGRIHMVFLDSRNVVQNDNTVNGMFDVYYTWSDDEGASWGEQRLTPSSWNSNNDGLNRGSQFLGDYFGLGIGGNLIWPCYLDTSNGDTDTFTNRIINPTAVADAFVITRGLLVSGEVSDSWRSDNNRIVAQERPAVSPIDPSIRFEFDGNVGIDSVNELRFTLEASCDAAPPNVVQKISLFNVNSNQWEVVDQRNATQTESVAEAIVSTNPNRFIQPGTHTVRARVGYFDPGTLLNPGWKASIDEAFWTIDP